MLKTDSLRTERSLFRRQRAAIASVLAPPSADFKAYEARHLAATRTAREVLAERVLLAEVRAARVVFVGDYHTLKAAQDRFLQLAGTAPRAQLAIGDLPVRAQPRIDAYLARRASLESVLEVLELDDEDPFGPRPRTVRLLTFAKKNGCPVVALDTEPRGRVSLSARDERSGKVLAEAVSARPELQTLVLSGQYHVTPAHLPRAMRKHLAGEVSVRVVYQNCEQLYFRFRDAVPAALRLGPEELCWMTASPLACQQSFLDCLDAEEGDLPLETSADVAFREMAGQVARVTGVDISRGLRQVRVRTPADGCVLEDVRTAHQLNLREQGQVRRHVLALQSGYFPRARLAFLARGSVNHAAEEASHFVRHCQVGDAMDQTRSVTDAFYARCLEEAFGFFGSRLVNPGRQCRDDQGWAEALESDDVQERRSAGFYLAHRAAEREGTDDWEALVPPVHDGSTFHEVSHGLGYALGAKLHHAFVARTVSRAQVRKLFADPLENPRDLYLRWAGTGSAGACPLDA